MPTKLTKDERTGLIEVTDNFFAELCGCPVNKAGEGKMFPFENSLVELLLVEWGDATTKSVTEAVKHIGTGNIKLTQREINKVMALLSDGISGQLSKEISPELLSVLGDGYKRGKKDIFKKFKVKAIFDDIDDSRIDWLHNHHMYWIDGYYDKHVSEGVAKTIASGLEQGLGRKDIGSELKTFFDGYPGISQKPESYWRSMAANGMNRSRNFGMLQAWEELGTKSLEIRAVMDERTSAICRELNGKIIPVASALGQRDLMIASESPEDIKTIAPWPSLKSIKGKSIKSITSQGIIMPPFHGFCRTTVIKHFS